VARLFLEVSIVLINSMCGISGIIGNINDNHINSIKNMVTMQSHRGPDGHRVIRTPSSLLGFSRLKIIDFDDRAMQPIISKDKKYILLFNGEIYNYKKLKANIGNKYRFTTTSDTEVLLAMLILYGIESLKHINGMFAFCFYDVEENTYILARDRFGQKPLYFTNKKNYIYFASEIKSLLASGLKPDPNLFSIADYLFKGELDCNENTLFQNIQQVKPGTYIKIQGSKIISNHQWYDLEKNSKLNLPKNDKELYLYINDKFTEVCEEHLNSDTDIGIKLSGGLDSSTMLASMEKNKKYLSNSCFSVDFGNTLSEKEWINNTANYFGKESNIYHYEIDDFLNDFDHMIFTHEGPLGGLMNCAFENIYKNVNTHGIRVLLDGTGLDEAFGGYRVHHLIYLYRLYNNNDEKFLINLQHYSDKWKVSIEEVKVELNNLKKNNSYVQDGSTFNQNIYTSKYLQDLNKPNISNNIEITDSIRSHLINYIECSKIPKNTRIKDRQSMSYSIELRMPFLDQRIIELGLSLDENKYFNKGLTKSIIRNVMQDKLPDKVRLGQKRSIQAPQGEWLKNYRVSEMVLDLLYSEKFKNRGLFDTDKVISTYKNFLVKGAKNTFHIWQWINIEKFFQLFIDKKVECLDPLNNIQFIQLHENNK